MSSYYVPNVRCADLPLKCFIFIYMKSTVVATQHTSGVNICKYLLSLASELYSIRQKYKKQHSTLKFITHTYTCFRRSYTEINSFYC